MIVNPSVQTMIPRRNNRCKRSYTGSRPGSVRFPGGRMLWYSAGRALLVSFLMLAAVSVWARHSTQRLDLQIGQVEALQNELVNTNIILRAQKARLFSPQAVESLAGQQLALQLPGSGQYRKF